MTIARNTTSSLTVVINPPSEDEEFEDDEYEYDEDYSYDRMCEKLDRVYDIVRRLLQVIDLLVSERQS